MCVCVLTCHSFSRGGRQIGEKLEEAQRVLRDLDALQDELFPLARRATLLWSGMRSLASIEQLYQFDLPFFIALFDEAVDGELPPEYLQEPQSAPLVRRSLSSSGALRRSLHCGGHFSASSCENNRFRPL